MRGNDSQTVKIKLKNKTPYFNNREVILSSNLHTLLIGKGEGAYINIYKSDLQYK